MAKKKKGAKAAVNDKKSTGTFGNKPAGIPASTGKTTKKSGSMGK